MQARDYQIEVEQCIIAYMTRCARERKECSGVVCLPTGTGKGFSVASLTKYIVSNYPSQIVMNATHVKELVEQNYLELLNIWQDAPAGVFSAGLGRKESKYPIIFGGVKSIVNSLMLFDVPDVFLIDEAHLLSPKEGTSYQKIIKFFRTIKPWMIVIGFTATHWRTGQGLLTDGVDALFKDIIIDLTTMAAWERFVAEGYLLRPVPKETKAQIDISNVKVESTGDLNKAELEEAADRITLEACKEMVEAASERNSWLIFASGVKHAEHVAKALCSLGIEALAVHSKLEKGVRDERIKRFKSGSLRCVVNNNVLTTGFNYPGLDFIGMLRPTMSVGLWIQMLGRGTRPLFSIGFDLCTIAGRLLAIQASYKQDCLVLDFARNRERLGPINDPVIPNKKRKGGTGLAPVRVCPKCNAYNHANASICEFCGHVFEKLPKLVAEASIEALFKEPEPIIEQYDVLGVNYYLHHKDKMPLSMKVEYTLDKAPAHVKPTQYFHFEIAGGPKVKTNNWWKQRSMVDAPTSTLLALDLAHKGALRVPKSVRVWLNSASKHPEIIGFNWR